MSYRCHGHWTLRLSLRAAEAMVKELDDMVEAAEVAWLLPSSPRYFRIPFTCFITGS